MCLRENGRESIDKHIMIDEKRREEKKGVEKVVQKDYNQLWNDRNAEQIHYNGIEGGKLTPLIDL